MAKDLKEIDVKDEKDPSVEKEEEIIEEDESLTQGNADEGDDFEEEEIEEGEEELDKTGTPLKERLSDQIRETKALKKEMAEMREEFTSPPQGNHYGQSSQSQQYNSPAPGQGQTYPQGQNIPNIISQTKEKKKARYIALGVDDATAASWANDDVSDMSNFASAAINISTQKIQELETKNLDREQKIELDSIIRSKPYLEKYKDDAWKKLKKYPAQSRNFEGAVEQIVYDLRGRDEDIESTATDKGRKDGMREKRIIKSTSGIGSSKVTSSPVGVGKMSAQEINVAVMFGERQGLSREESIKRYANRKKDRAKNKDLMGD